MSANASRLRGAAGTYEVWYTTWNHPVTDQGFWLRFLVEAPTTGPARGELWFAAFDPRRPARTFGIHRRFSLGEVATTTTPFGITIAGAHLADDRTHGALAGGGHDVRWDLRFTPLAPAPLRMLPDLMYARGGVGDTTVLSPNPRVALAGTLVVDGEALDFDGAIAGQSHVWGKKHAYSWIWGRCADFADAPDALLELLGVRLLRGGVVLPPLALLSLDLEGERHRFNQLRHVVRNRATWGTGRVDFRAWSPRIKVAGELTCTPAQMVLAPYEDPDGTVLTCANTEIGDARLTVWQRRGARWRETHELVAHHRAHFEIGGRTGDPAITRAHVLVGDAP